jgi:hypothetical protein
MLVACTLTLTEIGASIGVGFMTCTCCVPDGCDITVGVPMSVTSRGPPVERSTGVEPSRSSRMPGSPAPPLRCHGRTEVSPS